jgi:hypothetical protein
MKRTGRRKGSRTRRRAGSSLNWKRLRLRPRPRLERRELFRCELAQEKVQFRNMALLVVPIKARNSLNNRITVNISWMSDVHRRLHHRGCAYWFATMTPVNISKRRKQSMHIHNPCDFCIKGSKLRHLYCFHVASSCIFSCYDYYCLLNCNAVLFGEFPTFRRNVYLPSSWSKRKTRNKPAEAGGMHFVTFFWRLAYLIPMNQ